MAYSLTTSGLTVGSTLSRNCVPNEGLLGYALSNAASYISATSWNVGTISHEFGHVEGWSYTSTVYAPASNPYEFRKWSLSGTLRNASSIWVGTSQNISHTLSIRLPSSGRYLAINSTLNGAPVSGGAQIDSKVNTGKPMGSQYPADQSLSGTYTYYRIS